jgi:hypothetical protein
MLLDLITGTIFGDHYRSLSSSLCSFLYSLVTSSVLDLNILLNTLYSDSRSLHFLLNVSDQVSHPYKTTRKITVLHILIIYSCGPEHWKTKHLQRMIANIPWLKTALKLYKHRNLIC